MIEALTANDLADDLVSLLTGDLSLSRFRAKYAARSVPGLPGELWDNLEHYLADVDIRERDLQYGAMQTAEMETLVQLLRAGASDAEIARINFLGNSRSG